MSTSRGIDFTDRHQPTTEREAATSGTATRVTGARDGLGRRIVIRSTAAVAAATLAVLGSGVAAHAATPSLSPEDLVRSAASSAGVSPAAGVSAAAVTPMSAASLPAEMVEALESAAYAPAGVGTRTVVADPNSIVLDVHEDPYGDSPQVPELIGSLMQVPTSDPNLVSFAGVTDSATYPQDVAAVLIDSNGDGEPDLVTFSPDGFDADVAWGTPVYAVHGEDLVDTGSVAGWLRTADGYFAVVDRAGLNLTSARFTFGLVDTSMDAMDLAPNDFTGAPVSLLALTPERPEAQPAPKASVSLKAKSGKSKLYVNVNPNKGKGYWTFKVQKQRSDGSWKHVKTYKTEGNGETRTVNQPKGTYRVVVNDKYGYVGGTSAPVYLKK